MKLVSVKKKKALRALADQKLRLWLMLSPFRYFFSFEALSQVVKYFLPVQYFKDPSPAEFMDDREDAEERPPFPVSDLVLANMSSNKKAAPKMMTSTLMRIMYSVPYLAGLSLTGGSGKKALAKKQADDIAGIFL